jgi:hypothetical protein
MKLALQLFLVEGKTIMRFEGLNFIEVYPIWCAASFIACDWTDGLIINRALQHVE